MRRNKCDAGDGVSGIFFCLSFWSSSIFPFHGIDGNHPLLAKLTNVYTIDQFSVGNRFSQGAFVQPPQLCRIAECHQPVKRCFDNGTVLPQLVTGQIQFIVPKDPIATCIHTCAGEQSRVLLKPFENWKLVGAMAHVLVNDPTRGYVVFIENNTFFVYHALRF